MTRAKRDDIQLFYAKVIDRAAKVGFIFLLLTFAVYVSGIHNTYLPLDDVPRYWSQPAQDYLKAAGIKAGWAWLTELHHGDFLTFLPIAVLAGVTILGYLCVVGKFFRRREPVLGLMAIVQVIILILAASGIWKIGGH